LPGFGVFDLAWFRVDLPLVSVGMGLPFFVGMHVSDCKPPTGGKTKAGSVKHIDKLLFPPQTRLTPDTLPFLPLLYSGFSASQESTLQEPAHCARESRCSPVQDPRRPLHFPRTFHKMDAPSFLFGFFSGNVNQGQFKPIFWSLDP